MYQHYKLLENPYQVLQLTCAASERAMKSKVCIDKIIITIVPSYTRKNITRLLPLALLLMLQQTRDIFALYYGDTYHRHKLHDKREPINCGTWAGKKVSLKPIPPFPLRRGSESETKKGLYLKVK